jgi:hypothetical protein
VTTLLSAAGPSTASNQTVMPAWAMDMLPETALSRAIITKSEVALWEMDG